jgi:hypothetical protein
MLGSPGDVASLIGREYLSQVTRSNSAASQTRQVKTFGSSSYTITLMEN